MGKFNRFEEILAWQKSRELVKEIYDIFDINDFKKDYILQKQITGASISVMLNIAEGFGRKSNNEFKQFLVIAHGSVAEVQSGLYITLDRKFIDDSKFQSLYIKCDEISRMLMGLIKYLNTLNI
jgi:four helix bundle protein